MAKLNQIVAVVSGKKTETKKAVTELHRKCGNTDMFSGLSRTYSPIDEEGERFPDENKAVQLTVDNVLKDLEVTMNSLFDAVLTQDIANTKAVADIVVDGFTIATAVPVTYLMFLEKQLNDIHKFVSSLSTLDVATRWEKDENQGLYVAESAQTNKTKKVLQHKVLYEATKEHPAQIEKWTEDVTVGTWTVTKFSGAMTQVERNAIVDRVGKLQEAVKFAREEANSISVENQNIGVDIFRYLFG